MNEKFIGAFFVCNFALGTGETLYETEQVPTKRKASLATKTKTLIINPEWSEIPLR